MPVSRLQSFALALALLAGCSTVALAQDGKVVLTSKAPFARVAAALEQAIADQQIGRAHV